MNSSSMAAPREVSACELIFKRVDSQIPVVSSFGLVTEGLSDEIKSRLRKLFSEHTEFRQFMEMYSSFVVRGERATAVNEWLTTPLPLTEELYRDQIDYLTEKWGNRIALKRKKIFLILDILSYTKPTDKFENTGLFTVSLLFQAPGDFGTWSKDMNRFYILDLLEFALATIKSKGYGVDDLLNDPEVIQKMMEVNRKFAGPEFQDGRSGIYHIP